MTELFNYDEEFTEHLTVDHTLTTVLAIGAVTEISVAQQSTYLLDSISNTSETHTVEIAAITSMLSGTEPCSSLQVLPPIQHR